MDWEGKMDANKMVLLTAFAIMTAAHIPWVWPSHGSWLDDLRWGWGQQIRWAWFSLLGLLFGVGAEQEAAVWGRTSWGRTELSVDKQKLPPPNTPGCNWHAFPSTHTPLVKANHAATSKCPCSPNATAKVHGDAYGQASPEEGEKAVGLRPLWYLSWSKIMDKFLFLAFQFY